MVILLFVFFCISPVFVPEEFLFQGIQSVQEDGIGLFLIHALCAADCEITAVVAWKRGVECQQNRLPSGTGDDGIDNITLSKPGVKQGLVAVVPCSGFGIKNFVRWTYATSMENIKEGLDRLEKFLAQ